MWTDKATRKLYCAFYVFIICIVDISFISTVFSFYFNDYFRNNSLVLINDFCNFRFVNYHNADSFNSVAPNGLTKGLQIKIFEEVYRPVEWKK